MLALVHPMQQVFFEALLKSVPITAPVEQELKALGYDVTSPLPAYEGDVFLRFLEALRKADAPTLPPAEGIRQLGRRFVDGFRRTIVGRVATTALPLLGPRRFLPRIPGRLKAIRADVEVTVALTGSNSATVTFLDPLPLGDFFAGVLEGALRLGGAASPHATPEHLPVGYRLRLTW